MWLGRPLALLHMCLKVFARSLIKTPPLQYFPPEVTLIQDFLSGEQSLVNTQAAAGRP